MRHMGLLYDTGGVECRRRGSHWLRLNGCGWVLVSAVVADPHSEAGEGSEGQQEQQE